jgi:hypothetical protein
MDSTNNQVKAISVPEKNWLQRVTGILFEPEEIFKALNRKPDIITALLIPILSALFGGIAGIMLTYRTPDFIEKMNQLPDKGNPQTILLAGLIIGIIFALIFSLGALLLKSGIIHVFAPFLNGKGDYKSLLSILGYSCFPSLVFSFLLFIYVLSNPNVATPLLANLSMLVKQDEVSPLLFSFLSIFDLFSFWGLFLSVSGVSVVYKMTKAKAAIIIFSIWLISSMAIVIYTGVVSPKMFPKANQQTTESVETE